MKESKTNDDRLSCVEFSQKSNLIDAGFVEVFRFRKSTIESSAKNRLAVDSKEFQDAFTDLAKDLNSAIESAAKSCIKSMKARYMLRAHNIGENAVEAVKAFFAGKCFDEIRTGGKYNIEINLIKWSLDDLNKYLEILEQGK